MKAEGLCRRGRSGSEFTAGVVGLIQTCPWWKLLPWHLQTNFLFSPPTSELDLNSCSPSFTTSRDTCIRCLKRVLEEATNRLRETKQSMRNLPYLYWNSNGTVKKSSVAERYWKLYFISNQGKNNHTLLPKLLCGPRWARSGQSRMRDESK